jgi:DNA-binding NarL/FixJ family response regulator
MIVLAAEQAGEAISAVREIRARLRNARVIVIADDDESLFPALNAGADGYLLRHRGLNDQLPDLLWAAISGTGVAMPPALIHQMIRRFRDPNALRRSVVDSEPLTSREWQVLALFREGLTTAQIGDRLSISIATVRSHRRHIRRKIGELGDPASVHH